MIKDLVIDGKSISGKHQLEVDKAMKALTPVQHETTLVLQEDGTLAPYAEAVAMTFVDSTKPLEYLAVAETGFTETAAGQWKMPKVRYATEEDWTPGEGGTEDVNLGQVTIFLDTNKQTKYSTNKASDLQRYAQDGTIEAKITTSHLNRQQNSWNYKFFEDLAVAASSVNDFVDFDITTATGEDAFNFVSSAIDNLIELSGVSPYVEPGFAKDQLAIILTPKFNSLLRDYLVNVSGAENVTLMIQNKEITLPAFDGVLKLQTSFFNKTFLNKPHCIVLPRGSMGIVTSLVGLTTEKLPGKIDMFRTWSEYSSGTKEIWPEFMYMAAQPDPVIMKKAAKERHEITIKSIAEMDAKIPKQMAKYYVKEAAITSKNKDLSDKLTNAAKVLTVLSDEELEIIKVNLGRKADAGKLPPITPDGNEGKSSDDDFDLHKLDRTELMMLAKKYGIEVQDGMKDRNIKKRIVEHLKT